MARSIIALLMFVPMACFAHRTFGPHTAVQGFVHPLTGLDHLLAMVAVGWVALQGHARMPRTWTPIVFLVGIAAGFGIGAAGWAVQSTELGISLSVIALGALVARAVEFKFLWALTLIAGVFHGMAHGIEMPPNSSTMVYLGGLLAGSATLLFLGMHAHRLSSKTAMLPAIRVAVSGLLVCAGTAFLIGIA